MRDATTIDMERKANPGLCCDICGKPRSYVAPDPRVFGGPYEVRCGKHANTFRGWVEAQRTGAVSSWAVDVLEAYYRRARGES